MLEIAIFSTRNNSVKRLQTADNILELENIPFFFTFSMYINIKTQKKIIIINEQLAREEVGSSFFKRDSKYVQNSTASHTGRPTA
jgi:hypothetical protein